MAQTIVGSTTLQDVAERANVSPSTVSRTLTRPEMVAAATRARVLKAAKELRYEPNQLARSLRQQSTRFVGLILADMLNEFYAHIAKGVQDAASGQGYVVMVTSTDENAEREASFLQELQRHRFRGLIIVPTEHTRDHLRSFHESPVVEVDRTSGYGRADVVLADNMGGSMAAIRHLVELGHRRIATISGRLTITTGMERLEGYRTAMAAAGLEVPENLVVDGGAHDEQHGYEGARRLFAQVEHQRPTAVFAFNNEITAGVLRGIRDAGLQVPRDVSVVGFDDSRWAQLMSPALTVVAQPAYDMGYLAAERLFSKIQRPLAHGTVSRLATELVVRDSTAPPPDF